MTSAEPSTLPRNGRGVLAVLGPTNTGKTHLAIERMVAHESGLIGLPLRLLAREVYARVADKVGAANVALITGEEKINADGNARFQVCTVEAMPARTDAAFVAIDEVQLAADLERGHVFTDRILNLRGRQETMLLGAATVQRTLQELLPGLNVVTRPRMSMLTWAGQKKITRLPQRSAIVAFSADEVYAIAELIRRQRGGAAVVLGSLSPRTRNAQVALYQSGDVDFLVATDAIGMGLNLDLDHVAFAQDRKFDGITQRRLHPAEMAQIAGRAGRHTHNGTFGVTGQVPPFEEDLIQRLETHEFDPVKVLTWRNRDLEFSAIETLRASLEAASTDRLLMKSFPASDLVALDNLSRREEVVRLCGDETSVRLLWDVCQTPDYRRISPGEHAELLQSVFTDLATNGTIDEDWFASQIKHTDRLDGDIDALSARIAHIRTWTYLSNRPGWLPDPVLWQERTREIEDRLSDVLHENLTKRFIDRRTSVLMKRLRENAMLEAEIGANGDVNVEGHHVGQLRGFRFTPDAAATGPDAKAASGAALKALATEIVKRSEKLSAAPNSDIVLDSEATLRWLGEPVGKLVSGEDTLKPRVTLLADEQLTGASRDAVARRLERWTTNQIATLLKPLVELASDETLAPAARGVAFRLVENLGVIERREIASEVQSLDQDMRAGMRRHGVRFGAFHIFIPALLKPAPISLICLLWGLKNDRLAEPALGEISTLSAAGRTSFPAEREIDRRIYQLCGFRVLGSKAVRIDMLERLADLIRPALSWKAESGNPPPEGAIAGRAFYVTPAMLSILGATHEDMENVLKGLGYRGETKTLEEFNALKPATAKPLAQKSSPLDSTPTSQPEPVSQGASADTAAAQPASVVAEGSQPPLAADTAETETEKERTVTLWRPGRQDHKPRNAGKPRPANSAKKGKIRKPHKGKAPGQRPGGKPAPKRNAKREAPVDPDSPFAKLLQLKADLEKGDG